MPDIAFYQLKRQSIEQALFRLLDKALANGARAAVRVGSDEEMEALDAALWTLDPDSFLPHATIKGKFAAEQPVVITSGKGAPNGAKLVFLLPGGVPDGLESFERAFVIFDGGSERQLKDARALWKGLKGKGLAPAYWTQSEGGAWEKQEL